MNKNDVYPNNARDEAAIFDELKQLCCSPGFIHAIAYFCFRDNITIFSGNRVTEKDIQHNFSRERLLTTEISTLIGLMIKGEMDFSLPTPDVIRRYISQTELLLHEMHMSFQKPWWAALISVAREHEHANRIDPFGSADGLREPIFYGGESAYNFQYEQLAAQKYAKDADWLEANKKFFIEEACIVARALGNLLLQNVSRLCDFAQTHQPDHITFLPAFTFSAHDLAGTTGFDLDKIERILRAFAVDLNLLNASFVSMSSFNEISAAPIIGVSGGFYILLQHYALLEAIYESPFFWMAADKSYAAKASQHRGAFAENFLAERLARVFGAECVFQNVDIYKGKDRVSEADVLVIFGDYAIVAQAKSKRMTIEARKGNDLQLRDDFKKAIHDAYDQCLLCSDSILDIQCRFILQNGQEIKLIDRPTKIFPICVVADHFPALSTQVDKFLNTRITKNIRSPVVADVFFLDVLTEMLETPLHFLNYLTLRARFDKKLSVNKEVAILGFHLKHNLWLQEKYDMVNLGDDFTASLDIAMYARRLGVPGDSTPKGILTRFEGTRIGRLILEFEASKRPELVGIGMLLLQLGSKDAQHINNGIDQLVRSAANDRQHHDMSISSIIEFSGFTIHVNSLKYDAARQLLFEHCNVRKYKAKAGTWYGLLLAPGTGAIRGALSIEEEWEADPEMEKVIDVWPKKSIVPISSLSRNARRHKVGRNEPCPCGSGKKFKRCCLI